MRIVTSTALVLGIGLLSGSVLATEQASSATCAQAGSKVSQALANRQDEQAQNEKRMGLEFCNAGYYRRGMIHYAKAMEILGLKS
jgi:hypothetical protein